MWQNSKTQIVTKLKKENCDRNQNANGDKTQKLRLQENLKTQIVTKLKNPNCNKTKKNSNIDKIQRKSHLKECILPNLFKLSTYIYLKKILLWNLKIYYLEYFEL